MNHLNVIKSIKHIIKTNKDLEGNSCILVNGEWGIGKTHTINEWMKFNQDAYNVKCVSVFGKASIRDIENDILIKLVSLFKFGKSQKKN